jgi:ketosteroid isomerase-like protein
VLFFPFLHTEKIEYVLDIFEKNINEEDIDFILKLYSEDFENAI